MAAFAGRCTDCPVVDETRPRGSDTTDIRSPFKRFPAGDIRGTYVLLLSLASSERLVIGRLGTFTFPAGWYAYVGSACGPGGLPARLGHHLRIAARPHWHVDYVRARSRLVEIWYCRGPERREHHWAACLQTLAAAPPVAPGFGSSDCRCDAHLIAFATIPGIGQFRQKAAAPFDRKAPTIHRIRLKAS